MKTIRLGALIVLLGALVVGVPTANAAQLQLKAPSVTSPSGPPAACTSLTLSVRSTNVNGGTTTMIRIMAVPVACRGLAFQLTAYSSGGVSRASASLPTILAGTVNTTVTLSQSVNVSNNGNTKIIGIALTINGRGIATTWLG
ncbi:MAG: hypothetical protein QOD05_2451 [Microbacteriaceae bacterium]|jgi:hypothetical protein|nr:hypothetical protein [Microbacteriaceae bacterium]